jgi:hypothetical protein
MWRDSARRSPPRRLRRRADGDLGSCGALVALRHRRVHGRLPPWDSGRSNYRHLPSPSAPLATDAATLAKARLYWALRPPAVGSIYGGRIVGLWNFTEDVEARGFRRCARWLVARLLANAPGTPGPTPRDWDPFTLNGAVAPDSSYVRFAQYISVVYHMLFRSPCADSIRRIVLATGAPNESMHWADGAFITNVFTDATFHVAAARWLVRRYRARFEHFYRRLPEYQLRIDEMCAA